MTRTPSAVRRRSARASIRARNGSGKLGECATSKRSSTALATLLTFCPPGPDARTKLSESSLSGIFTLAETSSMSVPEIFELERHLYIKATQQCDRHVQIVFLLAGDTQFVALDLCIDLELRILDALDNVFRERLIDSLFERDFLLRAAEIDFRIVDFRTANIDVPARQSLLENVEHLLELKFRLRFQRHHGFFGGEFRAGSFEIETRRKLSISLVDRVGQFVHIQFGDGVERWHVMKSRWRAVILAAVTRRRFASRNVRPLASTFHRQARRARASNH